MWRELDPIVKPDAWFATNTSSLAVVDQAAATSRPERFLGLHFFNPAQVMPLVEVIRAVTTSDEAFQVGIDFGAKLGKKTVQTRDSAGFIVNRLLVPYLLDAIRAYEEGVGSIAEIDDAMKAGAGHPMGPLTLADFVGLDTMGAICDVLFDEFRERRFARPPLLRKMLSAGLVRPQERDGLLRLLGRATRPEPRDLMQERLLELLRPPPHRGPLIAAGAVLVTLGVALEEIRLHDKLPIGVHLLILALPAAVIYALAVQARPEGPPYAFQSVLLVSGLAAALPRAADARRRARRRSQRGVLGRRVHVDLAAARRRRAVAAPRRETPRSAH